MIPIDDFFGYAKEFLLEETPVFTVKCADEHQTGTDFRKIELRESIVESCSFTDCSFQNASFIDVKFSSCDLSNSRFSGAYFERCAFVNCKCVGIDMSDTVIKQVSFSGSKLTYAYFDKAKLTDIFLEETELTEASISEAVLKRVQAETCKFIKNNFFKTMLSGMDFSQNEFIAPIVSNPPAELKGAVISPVQAVDLIGLWGVTVK